MTLSSTQNRQKTQKTQKDVNLVFQKNRKKTKTYINSY